MMDFDVCFTGGSVDRFRTGSTMSVHWPSWMSLPRVGEAVTLDTTSLMIDRGLGEGPSGVSARPAFIDGTVVSVRHRRAYDSLAERDRVKWLVEVELR